MNHLFRFLKKTSIVYFLILQFSSNTLAITYIEDDPLDPNTVLNFIEGQKRCAEDDPSDPNVVLSFMPGQKKCLEFDVFRDGKPKLYFRNLREFRINKNGKYCLWDSENWDKECQDASMHYAYGSQWEEAKKLVIKFIRFIQNAQYDKALALTSKRAVFFTHDEYDDLPVKRQSISSRRVMGYRAYMNPNYEKQDFQQRRLYGDFDIELFRRHIAAIDTSNLKFFLSDTSRGGQYSLLIQYEDQKITKYLIMFFKFSRSREGVDTVKLDDMSIYINLPEWMKY